MKIPIAWHLFSSLILLSYPFHSNAQKPGKPVAEKTSFQIAAPWMPAYDIRSDIAIVYGMNSSFPDRVKSYRDQGYNVQFMTGIAWGEYQDYFTGRFDGRTHPEDGQVQRDGQTIWHGKDAPYIVPSASYLTYIKAQVKKAIDGGVTAIYLEEPEFWARAGYSLSFQKEWQQYYGFAWQPQDSTAEATYLSSKLKYHLYFNALKQVFRYAKSYSESRGARVKCYVPTHSLLNYSSWEIVSPEASLAALPGMDGYIAQVWTGTSREPTYFDGVKKERVFENAFLEYGSMLSMTAPTGRRIYFLTDPIEDYPRTWDDYRRNYQATFTAQLMYPSVNHYEVMPWPNRIYLGKFRLEKQDTLQSIPPAYATQVQIMMNALNAMPVSANTPGGSHGVGILLSNTLMFQRFPTHKGYEDPQLSDFYGMALPLLKAGIPVETVHMENLSYPATLKDIRVLVMSYSDMKPPSEAVHRRLADWVKQGGVLLYYGRDQDPFQEVREWWNTKGNHFKAPSEQLFGLMKIHPGPANKSDWPSGGQESFPKAYAYGRGKVFIVRQDPKELIMEKGGHGPFLDLVSRAYESISGAGPLQKKNYFCLERGPYTIAAVLDESADSTPLTVKGPLIDLFDPTLPVLSQKQVLPGEQAFLYDLSRAGDKLRPAVLVAASRVYGETFTHRSFSFLTRSPSGTWNSMRIRLPSSPVKTSLTGPRGEILTHYQASWDAETKTCLLRFGNNSEGIHVRITW